MENWGQGKEIIVVAVCNDDGDGNDDDDATARGANNSTVVGQESSDVEPLARSTLASIVGMMLATCPSQSKSRSIRVAQYSKLDTKP